MASRVYKCPKQAWPVPLSTRSADSRCARSIVNDAFLWPVSACLCVSCLFLFLLLFPCLFLCVVVFHQLNCVYCGWHSLSAAEREGFEQTTDGHIWPRPTLGMTMTMRMANPPDHVVLLLLLLFLPLLLRFLSKYYSYSYSYYSPPSANIWC